MNAPFKPVTVAVTGGSCSGKTTFVKALAEELASFDPVTLHQDAYFRDWSEFPPDERERAMTANHPNAVRWETLLDHVTRLISRQPVSYPIPGTRSAVRGDAPSEIGPTDLILVEGHLILTNERLRELADLRLFLDVDAHERVLRRMMRDVASRGGDLERAVAWYRRDVIPNFPVHTEPTKRFADLVIPYHHENRAALRTVAAGIRALLEERIT